MPQPASSEAKPTNSNFRTMVTEFLYSRSKSRSQVALLLLVLWTAAAVAAAVTVGDGYLHHLVHSSSAQRRRRELETDNALPTHTTTEIHLRGGRPGPAGLESVRAASPPAVQPKVDVNVPSTWKVRAEPVRARGLGLGPWNPPAGVNTSAVGPGPTWYRRGSSGRVAVVRISKAMDPAAAVFAEEIGSYPNYDSIMVSDEEPENGAAWAVTRVGNVTMVQVNAQVAEAAGFSHSHVHAIFKARRRTLSQDKAMFYLARLAPDPSWAYVWLIEDDVFVPGPSSFAYFESKYPNVDVLCKYVVPEQTVDTPAPAWNNWPYVQYIPAPRWRTLASAIRVSNRLLDLWLHFAREHGRLAFHECLPLTLAMHANYSVEIPKELSTMSCCNTSPFPVKNIVKLAKTLPHAFWHRIKNVTHHQVYRDALSAEL